MRIISRPEISKVNAVNSGWVSLIIRVIENNNAIRMTIASMSPIVRPLACWCCGNLPARIAMKIILSMPSTISRAVRVMSASQISGFVSHVM